VGSSRVATIVDSALDPVLSIVDPLLDPHCCGAHRSVGSSRVVTIVDSVMDPQAFIFHPLPGRMLQIIQACTHFIMSSMKCGQLDYFPSFPV
jgi:hypothetical protein